MDCLLLATRYLLKRPIILISMFGVLLGIGSLIVVDSVMNGFLGLQREMIRGTHADVSVRVPKSIRSDSEAMGRMLEAVAKTEGVAAVSLRLYSASMFRRVGGKDLAGYRNRLVRFYHEVGDEELYELCSKKLGDLDQISGAYRYWVEGHPEKLDEAL